MVTLTEVQSEVNRQIQRDYGGSTRDYRCLLSALGLAEEAGEVEGLMKRVLRGLPQDIERASKEHFIEELGDVLWYLAACCEAHEISLEDVWLYNIKKLKERYG